MPEFALPLSQRDRAWIELRERLAHAAREIHFIAIASDAANGPVLLTIADGLANLAMTIPLSPGPAMLTNLVEASTLLAAQLHSQAYRTRHAHQEEAVEDESRTERRCTTA